MSKFALGEIAEHVGGVDYTPGELVVIIRIGPIHEYEGRSIENGPADYVIEPVDDRNVFSVCDERELRKRKPPASPFSFDEIISMCNGTDIRPTETQVREGLKGILQPFGEKAGEG